jgi:predicted transcriptional regulator with HTH domain
VAEEALYDRYRISIVESVEHSFVNHGHRYLKVQTNRGFRYFNLKEPGKNVTHVTDDHLVIRDSMGNRYEIQSVKALDAESRQRLELVL